MHGSELCFQLWCLVHVTEHYSGSVWLRASDPYQGRPDFFLVCCLEQDVCFPFLCYMQDAGLLEKFLL